VDHTVTLPLAQLTPGPHLLDVEATLESGAAVRREVRCEVR
jgi:hypothetical protein